MNKITPIILLDFDGTLADTASVIINTMHATHRELSLPPRNDKECASMIGLRLSDIPQRLFNMTDIGALYMETYRRLFHTFNVEDAVSLYPHVKSTLESLKKQNIILTIASSRSHASLEQYIKSLKLTSYIDYILGEDDVIKGKPNPEPVLKTLQHFGLKPEDAIVVGDTHYDIEMGKNAGTLTCGVTYGNGKRESLCNADWTIDEFSELLNIIRI